MDNFSKKINEETKIPEGQFLKYHGFILCKIFQRNQIYEIDKIFNSLCQKSENVEKSLFKFRDVKKILKECDFSVYGIRWYNVGGFFSKQEAKKVNSIILSPIVDLPDGIESVHFYIAQIIPSLISLLITVKFNDVINEKFIQILNKEYERTYEKNYTGCKVYDSDVLKRMDVNKFVFKIENSFIEFISSISSTSFQEKAYSIFPIFSLSKVPLENTEILKDWLLKNREFLQTIGIDWPPVNVYKNKFYFFAPFFYMPEENNPLEKESRRVILVSFDLVEPNKNLLSILSLNFIGIAQIVAIGDSYIKKKTQYFVEIGKSIDTIFKFPETSIDKVLQDYVIYLDEEYLPNLVIEEVKSVVTKSALISNYLPKLQVVEKIEEENDNIYVHRIQQNLNFLIDILRKQIETTKDRYNKIFEYLTIKTQITLSQSNFKIQKRIYWLTWVLIILTIVSVISAIPKISCWCSEILSFLKGIRK